MFVALFGLLLLREKVDSRVLAAIAVGFGGTLVVVLGQNGGGGGARSLTGVGAALFSAVSYALSMVLLRQRAQRDKFMHIVLLSEYRARDTGCSLRDLGLAAGRNGPSSAGF